MNEIMPKNQETIRKDLENSLKELHSYINNDTNSLLKNSVNKENGKDIFSYEDAEKELFADKYAPYLKGIFLSTALIGLILLTTKKLVK
jgi:hypothetical protein